MTSASPNDEGLKSKIKLYSSSPENVLKMYAEMLGLAYASFGWPDSHILDLYGTRKPVNLV